jgi:hypothetical protein
MSLKAETWWLVRPLVRFGGGFFGPRTVRGYFAVFARCIALDVLGLGGRGVDFFFVLKCCHRS